MHPLYLPHGARKRYHVKPFFAVLAIVVQPRIGPACSLVLSSIVSSRRVSPANSQSSSEDTDGQTRGVALWSRGDFLRLISCYDERKEKFKYINTKKVSKGRNYRRVKREESAKVCETKMKHQVSGKAGKRESEREREREKARK